MRHTAAGFGQPCSLPFLFLQFEFVLDGGKRAIIESFDLREAVSASFFRARRRPHTMPRRPPPPAQMEGLAAAPSPRRRTAAEARSPLPRGGKAPPAAGGAQCQPRDADEIAFDVTSVLPEARNVGGTCGAGPARPARPAAPPGEGRSPRGTHIAVLGGKMTSKALRASAWALHKAPWTPGWRLSPPPPPSWPTPPANLSFRPDPQLLLHNASYRRDECSDRVWSPNGKVPASFAISHVVLLEMKFARYLQVLERDAPPRWAGKFLR